MNVFNQYPALRLRPFIDRLWGWENESPEVVHLPTLLPGTGAELYFHYGEPFRIKAKEDCSFTVSPGHLFCIRSRPINLSPISGIGFIAVRFKIGMLQRFTDIPANELADCQLSVEDIWGRAGTKLLRHLSYAIDRQERIALIQSFLADHLRPSTDLLVEQAMTTLYRGCSTISIESLASTLSLGRRQLERRWKMFSGQSPNETKCLSRFQQTIRSLMLEPSAETIDRALACGYYDQAHFIHDFQRRVGLAPYQHLRVARTKTHFYNTPLRKAGILGTLSP
ncbi:hypothetical protein C5612_22480 [Pseudomonas frederiksbergensis]|uniref:HTH araC/xylS-type domain-containing protein n=1 Tax=Pseudomonas frederiksbergensis TaxID=104087 RepID=A0A2S8HE59_9PSED|nr:helix-turn-helix domain-containing protein [Pseudomonas frederiksbergensis]PQP00713.1 hypothetical protein C5612_22480 [Pseudomonas frederiksbergensis]